MITEPQAYARIPMCKWPISAHGLECRYHSWVDEHEDADSYDLCGRRLPSRPPGVPEASRAWNAGEPLAPEVPVSSLLENAAEASEADPLAEMPQRANMDSDAAAGYSPPLTLCQPLSSSKRFWVQVHPADPGTARRRAARGDALGHAGCVRLPHRATTTVEPAGVPVSRVADPCGLRS